MPRLVLGLSPAPCGPRRRVTRAIEPDRDSIAWKIVWLEGGLYADLSS
jgi:hypothetical protein